MKGSGPVHLVKEFFTGGGERSVKVKRHIVYSFLLKAASILITFLLVPLTLHYLGTARYGIWITLSSILGWIGFFDIGLGNGLRNKFAEAMARSDHGLARKYVSTTYGGMTAIFGAIMLLFFLVNPFLNWAKILNTPPEMQREVTLLATVVVVFFVMRFVTGLISVILTADQRPALSGLLTFLGNLAALAGVYIITKITEGSLVYIGIALSSAPVIVYIVASVWYFGRDYSFCRPSLKFFHRQYLKDLMSLGVQFFIINIAVLVIFTTSNLIITQLFSPAEVTPYNIAYRYFSMITMGFEIILVPLWTAFTDAYVKKDIPWIKNTIRYLLFVWGGMIVLSLIMLAFSGIFYRFWIGSEVKIPFSMSALLAGYVILATWCNLWAYFINGTGKIRISLYIAVFQAVANIPLAIFLARNAHLGPQGVVLATMIVMLAGAILSPIQSIKIIEGKDNGLWGK